MRNHMSAAMPVSRNPPTKAGCRSNDNAAEMFGANPPACAIPVFMSTFAAAMQTAVNNSNRKPARFTPVVSQSIESSSRVSEKDLPKGVRYHKAANRIHPTQSVRILLRFRKEGANDERNPADSVRNRKVIDSSRSATARPGSRPALAHH